MFEFDDMIECFDVEKEEHEIYVCGFATDICILNNALLLKILLENGIMFLPLKVVVLEQIL